MDKVFVQGIPVEQAKQVAKVIMWAGERGMGIREGAPLAYDFALELQRLVKETETENARMEEWRKKEDAAQAAAEKELEQLQLQQAALVSFKLVWWGTGRGSHYYVMARSKAAVRRVYGTNGRFIWTLGTGGSVHAELAATKALLGKPFWATREAGPVVQESRDGGDRYKTVRKQDIY